MIHFTPVPLLDIESILWKNALEKAEQDSAVGIVHAALEGDKNMRSHVAQIPEKVGAHVHFIGDESYAVVAGEGLLHYGFADKKGCVEWETPIPVTTGRVLLFRRDMLISWKKKEHKI